MPFLLRARVRLPGMSVHWFYQCTSGRCHPNATYSLGAPFAMDGSISAGCHCYAHRDHGSRDFFRALCQTSLLILCPLLISGRQVPCSTPLLVPTHKAWVWPSHSMASFLKPLPCFLCPVIMVSLLLAQYPGHSCISKAVWSFSLNIPLPP